MYYAMVFFCLAAGECAVATDDYSPYRTQEQCNARLAEMKRQILTITPFAKIEGGICKREGATT